MDDIDLILEKIRLNSATQSISHKKRYIVLKARLKWYRLPIIILSALNSIFSIGLQPFMKQEVISVVNSLMALICGIIGSIELYLQLNRQMETELLSAKDFYELATDIFKFLSLAREHRPVAQKTFIDEAYNRYIKLIQNSLLLKNKVEDHLTGYKLIDVNGLITMETITPRGDETPTTTDGSV